MSIVLAYADWQSVTLRCHFGVSNGLKPAPDKLFGRNCVWTKFGTLGQFGISAYMSEDSPSCHLMITVA